MRENSAKAFYDRISHVYDIIAEGGERAARERGLALLNAQKGDSALEIGHGTGHSLVALANAVGPSGHVSGVDISTGMHTVAAKRIAKMQLEDRVELLLADVPPLPPNLGAFDVIAMSFTLELFGLDTIPQVLAECRRVLRTGGRLCVVSMASVAPGQKEGMMARAYRWAHNHFPNIVDCQPIPLESILTNAGFSITHAERVDIFTLPVAIAVAT